MINEQIRDREVRLIGADGEQLGIVSSREAQKIADEAGLDLVKIAPNAKPPVCKVIDYGKYRYEQARKEKDAKKKQKTVELKEIRLSPNIEANDLNTKMNAAKKFLAKGNKVKITLRFRGREMAHVQQSKHILDDFSKQLEDVATVEKAAKNIGLAFQIQDDILDVIGDSKELGKATGSDAQNHKQTYVTLHGLEESGREVERLTGEAVAILDSFSGEHEFLKELLLHLVHRTK